MAYADQQMSGNKIIAIIIVALIHVAIGYALITGLAYSAAKRREKVIMMEGLVMADSGYKPETDL